MAKEIWNYTWGSWTATVSRHPFRNEYRWSVSDVDGNDTYDFYKHIDVECKTPKDAEEDMFWEINDRIGHEPKRQLS